MTKANDLVTLTIAFILNIDILDFIAARGIHVSQTPLVFNVASASRKASLYLQSKFANLNVKIQ